MENVLQRKTLPVSRYWFPRECEISGGPILPSKYGNVAGTIGQLGQRYFSLLSFIFTRIHFRSKLNFTVPMKNFLYRLKEKVIGLSHHPSNHSGCHGVAAAAYGGAGDGLTESAAAVPVAIQNVRSNGNGNGRAKAKRVSVENAIAFASALTHSSKVNFQFRFISAFPFRILNVESGTVRIGVRNRRNF